MTLHDFLVGAMTPELLLKLTGRNGVALPATDPDQVRDWYRFRDFAHFVEVYLTASACIRSPDDLEEVTRDFFVRQAQQNIRYTDYPHCLHALQAVRPVHPIAAMVEAGLAMCINPDDPATFDVTLTNEFASLAEIFAFDAQVMEAMTLRALEASFLPAVTKQQYRSEFASEFSTLRGLL